VVLCSQCDGTKGIEDFIETHKTGGLDEWNEMSETMEDEITWHFYNSMGLDIPKDAIKTKYSSIDILLVLDDFKSTLGFLPWLIAFTEILYV